MPRYFFYLKDCANSPDYEGTELPDRASARAEAIRLSGKTLRDMSARFWDATEWRLTVSDESGRALFVLGFSAEEADAGRETS